MSLIVQKYGGTSVATAEHIKNIARYVVDAKNSGHNIVVVVSASGNTTDELILRAKEITKNPPERELDMLLATGEQISIALLAMAINELGAEAISFTGAQVGIMTDSAHTKARIVSINPDRILAQINKGKIVIVAGFQGVTDDDNITTLGRGGSDTTAVAVAGSIGAEVCEIYTDVEGVYTADPRIVPNARLIENISFEEMLEMAATGAKVLQVRAVEFGRNNDVMIRVRSSFTKNPGTLVQKGDQSMEQAMVSGVTHDESEAKITVIGVPDKPGIAAAVFAPLAQANVNVDMIIQNVSQQGETDISFTIPSEDINRAMRVIERVSEELGAQGCTFDENIAKVSLIGAGMKTNPGVAAKMFETLAENGINIEMISTSSIKISCAVRKDDIVKAVKALHEAFELDKGE